MKLKPIQFFALLSLISCILSSCGTTGDAVNPTISEMDKLDLKWGLPARQSRGTPRRTLPSAEQLNMPAANAAPAAVQPAPAYAAPAPASQPAPITVDPSKLPVR